MRKVLIIGCSHVASIMHVSHQVATDAQLIFLPALSPICNYIEIEGTELILLPHPTEFPEHPSLSDECFHERYRGVQNNFFDISGKANAISLRDFDAVVIYGGHFISIHYRWWAILEMTERYSLGLQSEMLKESLLSSSAYCWASGLSNYIGGGGELFLMLPPLLNELGLEGQHESSQSLSVFQETPNDADFRNMLPIYSKIVRELGGEFVAPPEEIFSVDGRGFAAKFKSSNAKDYYHLNPDGARMMLEKIVDRLQ